MTTDAETTFDAYLSRGQRIEVADQACLFRPGDTSQSFLIVLSGRIRVEQTNAAGRTVVLYRVQAGESCVLTTTCLLTRHPYSGFGYAEGPVTAVAITPETFHSLMQTDSRFQQLIFKGFAVRVGELTGVIDELLLHRTDLRLARWLAKHGATRIEMKQQEIAQEIGTAREVISRVLKSFERENWIELGRGYVNIINPVALAAHGAESDV